MGKAVNINFFQAYSVQSALMYMSYAIVISLPV